MRYLASIVALVFMTVSAFAAGDVEISGRNFKRDGAEWIAEGVTLVGFVAPKAKLTSAYADARNKFGPDLLKKIHEFGADTIRFQVSQAGLDPQSSIYDPNYKQEIVKAVKLSRSKGFTVIVSMQWQAPSGSSSESNMPSDATIRAWTELAGEFNADKGVLFEAFNEPDLKQDTPENWKIWQATTQPVVDAIRKKADNIILLGGLRSSKYLTSVPKINDPLNRLAYAVHPFLMKFNRTERQWEHNWGAFARKNPVIATAFNALSRLPGQCFPEVPGRTQELFDYLRGLQIGLVIWAFDLPGVVRGNQLTDFRDFKCGPKTASGAAEAVHEYFQAH